VCFCEQLPTFTPSTRVVFLQHPRERRVPISTCRMAHLAFAGSELHHGVRFEGNASVEALAVAARASAAEQAVADAGRGGSGAAPVTPPRVALLFPSPGAIDPASLPPGSLHTLVVVDGTWSQARKLVERNPLLAALPRLGLLPERPSNYRIRKEPADHCVSTIEAVVDVLGQLEGDRERYRGALVAFDHMVDTQIARRALRTAEGGPTRTRRKRTRSPKRLRLPEALTGAAPRAVIFYAEANMGRADGEDETSPVHTPELVHLVASRPGTGERFEAIIRPRLPLAPAVPHHIDLDAETLLAGEPVSAALARFVAFLRTGDQLTGWGAFGYGLLRGEVNGTDLDAAIHDFLDLRPFVSRRLGRRSGGIEQAALELASPLRDGAESTKPGGPTVFAKGRAGRRLAALEEVLAALVSGGEEAPRADAQANEVEADIDIDADADEAI
jgi:DTW domain-containing protein YfiP